LKANEIEEDKGKTFMDWISTACGDQWNSKEILKCVENATSIY